MTIEEMRQELHELCEEQYACSDCVLGGDVCRCGNGAYFIYSEPSEDSYMEPEEIAIAYLNAFGKISDPTPAADEEPHIRDSGSRTEFSTGAVRDIQKGKGRCDLMPLDVVSDCYLLKFGKDDKAHGVFGCLYNFIQTGDCFHLHGALGEFIDEAFASWSDMFLEVSKHFEEGAEKYGENNWQKGLPVKCYINSAVRHYLKWLRCDDDENHHLAFCWNVICAWWTCKHKPELNDYAAVKKTDFDPDSLMGEYEEEND